MKTLAELMAIKEATMQKMTVREDTGDDAIRIVVGMATCGIAAGARPVLNAFVDGVNKEGLASDVVVSQTGCIGICQYEPVVEVYKAGEEKVTYVKMTAEKVEKVLNEHIKGGKVVTEYTITAAQNV